MEDGGWWRSGWWMEDGGWWMEDGIYLTRVRGMPPTLVFRLQMPQTMVRIFKSCFANLCARSAQPFSFNREVLQTPLSEVYVLYRHHHITYVDLNYSVCVCSMHFCSACADCHQNMRRTKVALGRGICTPTLIIVCFNLQISW